jgi:hypothetical protein
VKHIFRIFTGVLPDYFLLNSPSTQNLRDSLANFNVQKENNEYNKQKNSSFFYKYMIYFHLVARKLPSFTRGYRHS